MKNFKVYRMWSHMGSLGINFMSLFKGCARCSCRTQRLRSGTFKWKTSLIFKFGRGMSLTPRLRPSSRPITIRILSKIRKFRTSYIRSSTATMTPIFSILIPSTQRLIWIWARRNWTIWAHLKGTKSKSGLLIHFVSKRAIASAN